MFPTSRWIPTHGLSTSFKNVQNSRGVIRNRCSEQQFSQPILTFAFAAVGASCFIASTHRWYTSLYGTSCVTSPATTKIASQPSNCAVSISRSTILIALARTAGSRDESGVSQCSPVETFDTTSPAFSTLRRSSVPCASVVSIWNHGTSPSHSSMPSHPDFFTSSSPRSNDQPLGIMLSPMDFFMAPHPLAELAYAAAAHCPVSDAHPTTPPTLRRRKQLATNRNTGDIPPVNVAKRAMTRRYTQARRQRVSRIFPSIWPIQRSEYWSPPRIRFPLTIQPPPPNFATTTPKTKVLVTKKKKSIGARRGATMRAVSR